MSIPLFPTIRILTSSEDLEHVDCLPECLPRFFIPRLAEKPQNPILDTVNASTIHAAPEIINYIPRVILPQELVSIATNPPACSIWTEAATRDVRLRNRTLSWNALLNSRSSTASIAAAFLSEQQDSLVYAAARYHVLPSLRNSNIGNTYVTREELFLSLRMTISGTSSALHTWDAASETFVSTVGGAARKSSIFLDGFDSQISNSIIQRFVSIGTLMRRLEILVALLRINCGPTIHAFAHALSTVLVLLRDRLADSPPWSPTISGAVPTLTMLCKHFEEFETVLVALSDLCGRSLDKQPSDYITIDAAPVPLLSLIYTHLDSHIDGQSCREILALISFMLDRASREYLDSICRAVGFGPFPPSLMTRGSDALSWDEFPNFFPSELIAMLPVAKQSLALLQEAQQVGYPLDSASPSSGIRWLWTETEIALAWNNFDPPTMVSEGISESPVRMEEGRSQVVYENDLALFELFDLIPGSDNHQSSTDKKSLANFQAAYFSSLPAITPTLSHLSSLVFTPLMEHVSLLSRQLVSMFLSPSSHVCIRNHLQLLRSTLLMTSSAFKSRVAAALFSDLDEFELRDAFPGVKQVHRPTNGTDKPWAVGLAPTLINKDGAWPPGGADLSFLLRTVIVDSLEHIRDEIGNKSSQADVMFEQAEYRLGFSIRDLPAGTGRERWLDPLAIEALDFLDLDYKPPHPAQVVITDETLSKYSRVFTFVLRLMRVEAAIATLHRMTRNNSPPLFGTLARSQKRLLHFRFIAQSFVKSLSAYVSDTAIGSTFDHFLFSTLEDTCNFSDVFALAASHSELLDDILNACMLRSGQRALGDLVRKSLGYIIDLCVLASQLRRGSMKEYEAVSVLDELFGKFCNTVSTLTKVLKALSEKNGGSRNIPEGHRHVPHNVLNQLLMRLDIGEWWMNAK